MSGLSLGGEFHLLEKLVACRSMSSEWSGLSDAVDLITTECQKNQFTVEKLRYDGAPLYILAKRVYDIKNPTLLFVAHYDVEPDGELLPKYPPFGLVKNTDRLYGRGVSNGKGVIAALLSAISKVKRCSANIIFLFEGEYYKNSPNRPDFLEKYKERLRADAIVVLDGSNIDEQTATLNNSIRGFFRLHIRVDALKRELFPDLGLLVPDPGAILVDLLATLRNPKEIPGFLDGVTLPTREEEETLRRFSMGEEEYRRKLGVLKVESPQTARRGSISERLVEEPIIRFTTLYCGAYMHAPVVQKKAAASVDVYTLIGQDPEAVKDKLVQHLQAQPQVAEIELRLEQSEESVKAWKGDLHGRFFTLYRESLQGTFKKVAIRPIGNANPLVADLANAFPSAEIIKGNIADPDFIMNGVDDSISIAVWEKTVLAITSFIEKVSALSEETDSSHECRGGHS